MTWLEESAAKEWNADSMDSEPLAQAFCREAALILEGMDALWRQADAMRANPAFPPPYVRTLQSDKGSLDGLRTACDKGMSALCGALGTLKFATLGRFKPATGDEERLAGDFKDLRNRIKDLADDLKKLLPADLNRAWRICRPWGRHAWAGQSGAPLSRPLSGAKAQRGMHRFRRS